MSEKVCAIRKSRLQPDVYTKKELLDKAISKGYVKKNIINLNRKELCKLLRIKWIVGSSSSPVANKKSTSRSVKAKELNDYNGRPCNKNKSKTNPTAYTKGELVEMVVNKIKIKKSTASSYTKPQLCYLLSVKKEMNSEPKTPVVKRTGDCITRSNLKLKNHQLEIVKYMRKHRGIIVSFGVGTGKTLTAVTTSQCFLDDNTTGKVIVVTPKSLQDNFKKEVKAYGEDLDRYIFFTFRKFAMEYQSKSLPKNTMLIIDESHELRTDYHKSITDMTRKDHANMTKWVSSGRKGNKPKPSVSNIVTSVKCAKQAEKILLLTATPVINKPYDVANLVAMVKGEIPMKEKEFDDKLLNNCKYFKNLFMFYKDSDKSYYPSRKNYITNITMTNKYYKEYKSVEDRTHHLWVDTNPHKFLVGLRQASNNLANSPKYSWIIKKLVEDKRKTLIYSGFLDHGVKPLTRMLNEKGIKYGIISGDRSVKDRNSMIERYNKDEFKILFITKAGGQGLDLKGTRDVILLEREWNDPVEEQVIGRAIRYKSHTHLPKEQQNVNIYYLILKKPKGVPGYQKTADEILSGLIKSKSRQNKRFLKMLETGSLTGPGC